MGSALAHIELALLCALTLALALQPALPMPRRWAYAGAALVAVQTGAVRAMRLEAFDPAEPRSSWDVLDTPAEVIALVVVPLLSAALFVVVFWHLARANARARARLARATAVRPSAATSPPAAEPPPARGPASRGARPG